jgi:hypothetical protein
MKEKSAWSLKLPGAMVCMLYGLFSQIQITRGSTTLLKEIRNAFTLTNNCFGRPVPAQQLQLGAFA